MRRRLRKFCIGIGPQTFFALALMCHTTVMLGLFLPARDAHAATAAEIKAVMLLGFAQLSEWSVGSTDSSDFKICLFGESEIGSALRAAVDGETALNRPIRVKDLDSLEKVETCKILFVADQREADFMAASSGLVAPNTLLVGDFSGFTKEIGAIEFYSDSGRVRFAVNVENAEGRGIRLSSRILSRARIIQDGG